MGAGESIPIDAFHHSLSSDYQAIYMICHPGYSLLAFWGYCKNNIGELHKTYDNKLPYVITNSLIVMNRNLDLRINNQYNPAFPVSYDKTGREVMNELLELAKIVRVNTDFLIPRTLTHINTLIDINTSGNGQQPNIQYGTFDKGVKLQFEDNKSTVIKITKGSGPTPRLINIDYLSTSQQDSVNELMEKQTEGDTIYIIIAS